MDNMTSGLDSGQSDNRPNSRAQTTILDKIVAKKLTPYGKIIPRAPMTMLKHEIVLLVTYRPPTLKGGDGGGIRFAQGFNLANPKTCIS